MVATTIELPNLRRQYIPDPGYTIVDCDLSGADAQVVAWEAEDEDLKAAFRSGLKIHIKNARDVFPDETRNLSDDDIKKQKYPGGLYHDCKRAVHATNYGGSAPGLAPILKWPVARCAAFQDRWFSLHPGIHGWHRRTHRHLSGEECWWCHAPNPRLLTRCEGCGNITGRTVGNRFGFRRIYFDRIDGLLPEALAWTPQSTVALVCDLGAMNLAAQYPEVELLLQVHDSIVFQVPSEYLPERKSLYLEALSIPVPYADPLVIPWGWSQSTKSWGDCA